jgi:outer membrane protein, heavy metal efflux system
VYRFKLFTGVAAIVAAGSVWAQPGAPATLNDLVIRAAQNNRDVLAVRQRMEEARGLLRQAGVRPALSLDVGGVTGRPLATAGEEQFLVGISREFERAGKRSKRIEAAEKQLALAEAEYQERVRQLRFEIGSRYADFAADAERIRVIDCLRDDTRRSIALTRARVDKGDAAALELNLQEAELGRVEAQRAAAMGRVESIRADISRLVGLSEGEAWSVAPQADPMAIEKALIVKQALERRPDLMMMRLLEQQGMAQTALAEAEGHANVTLSAGYGRVYSRFDDRLGTPSSGQPAPLRDRDDVLSIGVSVPLFSRNRNAGNIEAAAARARAARLRKESLERAIPLEIEAAWQRFESMRLALNSLHQQTLPLTEKNLAVIRQAYQLGQLRMLDVLSEQRRVFETELATIDARAELRRSVAEIERASGGAIR